MSEVVLSPRQQLQALRQQAQRAAARGDQAMFNAILRSIAQVRVIIEWPSRVEQRGSADGYRSPR